MKKIYTILILLLSIGNFAQTVTQAEYFWDTDPGAGNGISLQALDGNFNQALETVFSNNTTLPSTGNHVIGIRVKGQEGNWSSVFRKTFKVSANNNTNNLVKITQAEYFWDNDPGEGAGNIMLAFDGYFNQVLESVMKNDAALPSIGNHTIGIRVKADDGNWGAVYKKVFRISENNNSNNLMRITQAEYFWNADPGQGNGFSMLAFDGNFNQAIETISASNATLPNAGINLLSIRVKADDGNWGPLYSKVVGLDTAFNTQVVLSLPTNGATNVPLTSSFVWEQLTGTGTYEYQCATDNSFTNIVQSGIINGLSVPFSSLQSNTLYYWRVRANVSGNVSLWSIIWSFTTSNTLDNPIFQYENQIILYPNPTEDYTFIISKSVIKDIDVFDMLGKKVTIQIENNSINVSSLAQGVYLIKITTIENKIFSSRLIKK